MFNKTIKLLLNALLIVMFFAGVAWADRPRGSSVDLHKIVEGIEVKIVKVVFKEPITKYIAGEKRKISQVVRFTVVTKERIPTGAMGVFLAIGERLVFHFEHKSDNVLIFSEYEPEKLPSEGKVIFQWGAYPSKKAGYDTGVVFDKRKLKVIRR